VFEKAYFQILFLSAKDSKKGNRIEFSPPSKIEKRTCSIQKFFTELKKKFHEVPEYSVRFRSEKRQFRNTHEVGFTLFCSW
jgi:hypothetical protein